MSSINKATQQSSKVGGKGVNNYFNLGVIFCMVTLFTWGVTQYTAWRFGFQPALSQKLFGIGDVGVYAPWGLFDWWWKFGAIPEAALILNKALLIWSVGFVFTLVFSTIIVGLLTRKIGSKKSYDPFSSEWADDIDVEYSGLRAIDQWATDEEIKKLKK